MSEVRESDPLRDPELGPDERARLGQIDELLKAERPIPRPTFRGALGRRLLAQLPLPRARLRRVRALVAAYAGAGLCLLGIAALGVAGAGPFGA